MIFFLIFTDHADIIDIAIFDIRVGVLPSFILKDEIQGVLDSGAVCEMYYK